MNETDLNAIYERNKLEIFGIYQKYDQAWKEMLRNHREEGGPEPTVADKYKLKLGECDELIEQIRQHKRLLEFTVNGTVTPQAHEASIVLTPVSGMF